MLKLSRRWLLVLFSINIALAIFPMQIARAESELSDRKLRKALLEITDLRGQRALLIERQIKLEEEIHETKAEIRKAEIEIIRLEGKVATLSASVPVTEGSALPIVRTRTVGIGAQLLASKSVGRAKAILEIPNGSELEVLEYKYPFWTVQFVGLTGFVLNHYIEDSLAATNIREQRLREESIHGRSIAGRKKSKFSFRKNTKLKASARTSCCRVCKKGKPCGDSCISVQKQCHQPSGCAC